MADPGQFPSIPRPRRRGGMTLVETLMAMAIAAVVLTTLALSLWTLRRATAGLAARDGDGRAAREAMLDLAAAWAQAADLVPDQPALEAAPEPGADGRRRLLQWYGPHPGLRARGEWARMELLAEPAGPAERLLWLWSPLPGSEAAWPPETNVVWRAARGVRLEVQDNAGWRNDWPPEGAGPDAPRLPLRIRIEAAPADAGAPLRAQTSIPAAVTVTSRVLRASSAAR
jgi:prepilin-type N-terminal cleavage/methylation domain-containing protein